jgi:flagellin
VSLGLLTNIAALEGINNLNSLSARMGSTLQQLSSGSRINSAADDAAGLSMVNTMNANVAALSQSVTNTQESISMLRVADGALSQVTGLLTRAVTLATESSNGTLNNAQTTAADQEYQSILAEISNIGKTTTFNQQSVFGRTVDNFTTDGSLLGSFIDSLSFSPLASSAVGDEGGTVNYATPTGSTPGTMSYSSGSSVDLSSTNLKSATGAQSTLTKLNSAISAVSSQDGYLGAQINILSTHSAVLNAQETNTIAAADSIQATNYAQVTSQLALEQVQMQMAVAAIAQANSMNQEVVKLLQ